VEEGPEHLGEDAEPASEEAPRSPATGESPTGSRWDLTAFDRGVRSWREGPRGGWIILLLHVNGK